MSTNMILAIFLFYWMSPASCVSPTEATRHNQLPFPNRTEFMYLRRILIQKNTLRNKDNCSFHDEKGRESIGLELLEMGFSSNFSEIPRLLNEMNHTQKSSEGFCNSAEHLKCNLSGICGCVDGSWMGMKVKSIREDGICRLALGSDCVPQESLRLYPEGSPLKCQIRAECIIKGGGGRGCTEERIQTKLSDLYGGTKNVSRDPLGFMQFVKEKVQEGLCICRTPKRKTRAKEFPVDATDSVSALRGKSGWLFSAIIVSASHIISSLK